MKTYQEPEHSTTQPGAEPGIDPNTNDEHLPPHVANLKARCEIKIIDYSESEVLESAADNDDIEAFLVGSISDRRIVRLTSYN